MIWLGLGIVGVLVLLFGVKPMVQYFQGVPVTAPFARGFDRELPVFRRPLWFLSFGLVVGVGAAAFFTVTGPPHAWSDAPAEGATLTASDGAGSPPPPNRAAVAPRSNEREPEANRKASVAALKPDSSPSSMDSPNARGTEAKPAAQPEPEPQPEPESEDRASTKRDSPEARAEGQASAPAGSVTHEGPVAVEQAEAARGMPTRELRVHFHSEVQTVSPASMGPDFDADLLFFHAHPDDESLDYGLLMARAARAGKKIVTVLFTDGESGYDRYPSRPVNEEYPDTALDGRRLANTRVNEAERALSVLGSDLYVRLGLPNHPYGSITEELDLGEVLEAWGGEQALAERVTGLIRRYSPDVVVSPPGPSEASEHFEHEAVGHIVAKAVEQLADTGGRSLGGYLVASDPDHRSLYEKLFDVQATHVVRERELAVNAGAGQAETDTVNLRAIQLAALRQHVTQLDASVVGVKSRSTRSRETYAPLVWKLPGTLTDWLSEAVLQAGG
jgi:LmbE family N-acetylglucosaminyl deacetylase